VSDVAAGTMAHWHIVMDSTRKLLSRSDRL
jgi:hypothetical protein